MKIIITGVPCTGKTTVATLLSKKLRLPVTHVAKIVKKEKLVLGKNEKTKSLIIDLKKLEKKLLKKEGVIESHLLCEFSFPNSVVIVLRCNPKALEKRMLKRRYPKAKIKENLECEALDYCSILAEKNYGKKSVFDVDTTNKTINQTVEKCILIIKGKARSDFVDFSKYFLK